MLEQGFGPGACEVTAGGRIDTACRLTLKWKGGTPHRLIEAAHLSRPEHYFSIYQSGCNWSCKKCHSWSFTKHAQGKWMSPGDIAAVAKEYAKRVTYREPRERATSWHAHDLCLGCGLCVLAGMRSLYCPQILEPDQVVLSPQGFGPARNIIAFTGGDLACQPEFYIEVTKRIKALGEGLLVLFETNGYGLTPENLDLLARVGLDAFWLDIKAYEREVHQKLTGVSNDWVLKLPAEMLKRGFVLEVLSLYIPGWVETDQIRRIAELLAGVDQEIPFTILAFFPEYRMRDVPPPNLEQMLEAYDAAKDAGLRNIRLGNTGVFARTREDQETLRTHMGAN